MKIPLPRQYLGDGVTAVFDGFHIWLTTPRNGVKHEIALEPSVFKALTEFADNVWKIKADHRCTGGEGDDTSETPRLRWFEQYERCPCGKPAAGILRSDSNESYGPHCQRCADRRLRQSALERKKRELEHENKRQSTNQT